MKTVKDAFLTICTLLKKHQVDFIVIGGLAVVYHGFPRTTADADFWYKPTTDNFNKIVRAFEEFGIDVTDLKKAIFDPKKSFLRIPVFGIRAEFLPEIPGLISFDDAHNKASNLNLGEVSVKVLGYDDLIKNKASLNRPKDQQDIDELEKRNKGN